jgi:hypothetical protein
MPDQSQRDEMNAAIRAQRERQAVPRSIAGADEPPAPEPAAVPEQPAAAAAEPHTAAAEPEPVSPAPEPAAAPKAEAAGEPEQEQAARKGFWARLLGR